MTMSFWYSNFDFMKQNYVTITKLKKLNHVRVPFENPKTLLKISKNWCWKCKMSCSLLQMLVIPPKMTAGPCKMMAAPRVMLMIRVKAPLIAECTNWNIQKTNTISGCKNGRCYLCVGKPFQSSCSCITLNSNTSYSELKAVKGAVPSYVGCTAPTALYPVSTASHWGLSSHFELSSDFQQITLLLFGHITVDLH